MEIKDLTLEELKIVAAILTNIQYKLGDAMLILPIREKLIKTIEVLEPPKEDSKQNNEMSKIVVP